MNEKQTSAALGVVAVVLAYALYTRFKSPAAPGAGRRAPVTIGGAWDGSAPGAYVGTNTILGDAAAGVDYGAYVFTDDLIYGAANGGDKKPVGPVSGALPNWWG